MRLQDIIFTKKMRAVLADESQFIFLGGATGCSKSLVAGLKVLDLLIKLPKDRTKFYIIFKDRGTAERNFIQGKSSFYRLFPHLCYGYSASKVGGLQFKIKGLYSDKTAYLMGADDKTSWSKILGSDPDGIWLEELSELHIDLVRECMGRAVSRSCRLIATTNGGLPTQEFYTHYLNHSVVMFRDRVPTVELADMLEDKPNFHYYHFNLNDDAPHFTKEQRKDLLELHPPNTFAYNSKVLGVRGYMSGAAYAPLMDKEIHLKRYEKINIPHLKEIVLSLDIGSSKDNTNPNKSTTVATLVGFSQGYQRAIVLECFVIASPTLSHDEIIRVCEKRIEPYFVKYMHCFKKIVIDSAESILINTWAQKNRFRTIIVKGSIKHIKDYITLTTRCQLKAQLLLQQRLLWSDSAMNSYDAHTRILLDEDGSELDNNIVDNDIADSLTYALTENWDYLVRQERRIG